tara:strand:+ start:114807 stop:116324 length:1518 start_codon:yes stop_codon:yes gene_type:complete
MANQHTPVLIVGAGPTGLMAAVLLQQFNIPFRIVEQRSEPTTTSNALAVQARSLELWQRAGLIDRALARGHVMHGMQMFAGDIQLAQVRFDNINLDTPYPYALGLAQANTEALMLEHLAEHDIHVERNIHVDDVDTTTQPQRVNYTENSTTQKTLSCDYIIATDGCHSTLRKQLQLDFAGAMIHEKFIMMDAELETDFVNEYVTVFQHKKGLVALFPFSATVTRILATVTHEPSMVDHFENPQREDFEKIITERCNNSIRIKKPLWLSHFMSHHRIIENYRVGNIFFGGDSAHIHSPAGGQGMNTGMQDMENLIWKLALVINQQADASLLDTYNAERRPIAHEVLKLSTNMTHAGTLRNPILCFIRNKLMPLLLKQAFVKAPMVGKITELGLQYKGDLTPYFSFAKHCAFSGKRLANLTVYDDKQQAITLLELISPTQFTRLVFANTHEEAQKIIANHPAPESIPLQTVILTQQAQPGCYHDKQGIAKATYKTAVCYVRPDSYIT